MKTTRPIIPIPAATTPLLTPHLLLRPFAQSDLEAMHIIRSNPEVMYNTTRGLVDEDLSVTQTWLDRYVPPSETKNPCFAVCERLSLGSSSVNSDVESSTEGPLLGGIGLSVAEPPEVGYSIRREDWGKGYATEALGAFLKWYWGLERRTVDVEDDLPELKGSVPSDQSETLKERLTAMIEVENVKSRRVLEKCGFRLVEGKDWKPEPDHRGPATLVWYYLEAP